MADRGWLKLWRKFKDDALWLDEPFTKGQAWLDLLMLASGKDGGKYKAGCIYVSERQLADRWRWSRCKTHKYLAYLYNEGMVKLIGNDKKKIIAISKWSEYQKDGVSANVYKGKKDNAESKQTQKPKRQKKFHYEFINGERTMIIDADN